MPCIAVQVFMIQDCTVRLSVCKSTKPILVSSISTVSLGCDCPALKHLNSHVKNGITIVWQDVGVELLDPEYEPERILHCEDMLRFWLDKHPTATWNQLLKALRVPGVELNDLASRNCYH